MAGPRLTVVLPTRNRHRHCAAQLRFFRDCGMAHPIVVADSSDPTEAVAVEGACAGIAQYRRFDPSTDVREKFLLSVTAIETPFMVVAPDDDVTFPHAIEAALAYLEHNPGFVAALGYVLYFGAHDEDVDIHKVSGFVPTIADDDPVRRLYHLIRRYQPIIWAVFRTEAFAAAMKAASSADGLIFQELTFATTAVLAGKIARLPVVFSMRGMEESMSRIDQIHPLFWFVRDADEFFAKYDAYRNDLVRRVRRAALAAKPIHARVRAWARALWHGGRAVGAHGRDGVPRLARFIRNRAPVFAGNTDLQQVLDMIHGIWLGHELDRGILEHNVRQRLGDPMPGIRVAPAWPGWREPAEGDTVHPAPRGSRRYIWRREVLAAEPKEEITISADEMTRVERELDAYRLE
jgi:glycosyltransferase domain-containing protein